MEDTCRNCWQRVVLVNFAMGPSWVHQPVGASFQDGQHTYCHTTVAEPERKAASAWCPAHDTTLPCNGCSADHAAGEHTPGSHPATCARCATPTIPQAQLDGPTRAAGDDTLTDPEETR